MATATAELQLRERISKVATDLKTSFGKVVTDVSVPNVRPVVLAKTLGIDGSLAARTLRALRAEDMLSLAREIPAPSGLKLLLTAASKAGLEEQQRRAAEEAVRSFELLLGEFPTGRVGLDTAIDGWVQGQWTRGERAAKQSLFRSASQLIGHNMDVSLTATMIQPSRNNRTCDSIALLAKTGIRRMRAGSPIIFFGTFRSPVDPTKAGQDEWMTQTVETIDGEREVTDARKFILKNFGDAERVSVTLIERNHNDRLVLGRGVPPVNTPIDLAVAYIARNSFLRYQDGERRSDAYTYLPRVPTRLMVLDFYLHEDIYPAYVPELVPRLFGVGVDPVGYDDELVDLDRMELNAEMTRLGKGLDRVALKEFGEYKDLASDVFARAGWDPSRFRVYRCRVEYPVPFVSLTTWFDLPQAPEHSR